MMKRRSIIVPSVSWPAPFAPQQRKSWTSSRTAQVCDCPAARRIPVGGAAASWPIAARAQQPGKLPTIGVLGGATHSAESQRVAALVQRLGELGWIEGRTVAIEYRWAEGRSARLAEIAAEFVRL